MSPRIPFELAQARDERTKAWKKYLQTIERAHTNAESERDYGYACLMDDECHQWYVRWQALGGTSDILSIVEAEARNG